MMKLRKAMEKARATPPGKSAVGDAAAAGSAKKKQSGKGGAAASSALASAAEETPLHAAAKAGQTDSVVALLGAIASLAEGASTPGLGFGAALHAAVAFNHLGALQPLLTAAPSDALAELDEEGWGLLHVAAFHNGLDVAGLLLDQQVPPESANAAGVTPLMRSACHGAAETTRLLLERGAKVQPDAATAQADTALIAAVESGSDRARLDAVREAYAAIALAAGEDDSVCKKAADDATDRWRKQQNSIMSALLDANADPNRRDSGGWTALMYAAHGGNNLAARVLLRHGAEPDARTPTGRSPLMLAADVGARGIVKLLLDRAREGQGDVELDAQDEDGQTPLDYADSAAVREAIAAVRGGASLTQGTRRSGRRPAAAGGEAPPPTI